MGDESIPAPDHGGPGVAYAEGMPDQKDDQPDLGPAIDETVAVRGADTQRRRLEFSLFGLALALQVTAIVLRMSGSGFVEVVVSNWAAIGAYLVALGAIFARYRGWDVRKADPRNHTYYLLLSPLAGIVVVAMVGADRESGFTNTAGLVPGLIASSLAWGWAHNSRMAARAEFVESTETARTIFWGWSSIAVLSLIERITHELRGTPYVIPDLVYSLISLGAFLILVSTGYTQYIRAQEQLQHGVDRAERRRKHRRRRTRNLPIPESHQAR